MTLTKVANEYFPGMRDELIQSKQRFDEEQTEAERLKQESQQAQAAYKELPNHGLARAAIGLGLPAAGVATDLLRHKGPAAPIGTLAGIAGGIGGNTYINHRLNKQYPERKQLLQDTQDASNAYYSHQFGPLRNAGELYQEDYGEVARQLKDTPGLWEQMNTEGLPEREDMKRRVMRLRQQDRLQAEKEHRLAMQKMQNEAEGGAKENQYTDEKLRRMKRLNEEKEQKKEEE